MLPSRTCWSTEAAVWNWDLAPHLGLSDACTVHPQPTRFENFLFMHEIVQLVLRSNDLGSTHLVCGPSSERDERKEVEGGGGATSCWLAAMDPRLG